MPQASGPSTNPTHCWLYGRAPRCWRVDKAVPLHGRSNGTLIAALTKWPRALLRVNGVVDETVFTAYLDQVLDPTLNLDNVMLLNRLSVHKVGGLEQVIEKYGARLLHLPHIHPILTRLNGPSASSKPAAYGADPHL